MWSSTGIENVSDVHQVHTSLQSLLKSFFWKERPINRPKYQEQEVAKDVSKEGSLAPTNIILKGCGTLFLSKKLWTSNAPVTYEETERLSGEKWLGFAPKQRNDYEILD